MTEDLRRRNRLVAMVWVAICLTLLVAAILVVLIRGPIARKESGGRSSVGLAAGVLDEAGDPLAQSPLGSPGHRRRNGTPCTQRERLIASKGAPSSFWT